MAASAPVHPVLVRPSWGGTPHSWEAVGRPYVAASSGPSYVATSVCAVGRLPQRAPALVNPQMYDRRYQVLQQHTALPPSRVIRVQHSAVPQSFNPPAPSLGPTENTSAVICSLTGVDIKSPYVEGGVGHEAYAAFLEMLADEGRLAALPLEEATKALKVGIPFCGYFSEAELLLGFLTRHALAPAGPASAITVSGNDHEGDQVMWTQFEKWAEENCDPRVRLQLRRHDLRAAPAPAVSLSLGIHPRTTSLDCSAAAAGWETICKNVVLGTPRGLCAFATFTEVQAQDVMNWSMQCGARCEPILENQLYIKKPNARSGNWNGDALRFIVFAWTGGL